MSESAPPTETTEPNETARVEAFSDGVFAIAITLLILEVKVPHGVAAGTLWSALVHDWPSWAGFFLSFFSIGIMWANHHRLFSLIRRSDDGLLFYNGLLLLFVTIVPMPTAMVAQYLETADGRVAMSLYNLNALMIAGAYTLLWRYAAVGGRLLGRSIPTEAAEDIFRQYRFGPLLYVAAIGLSQVNAYAALILDLLLVIFFAIPPQALRKSVGLPCPSRP